MYDFLLTVHVLAAVLWVGGGVTMHALGRRIQKSGDRAALTAYFRTAGPFAGVFYAALSVILLIAGLLLVNEANYEFSQPWIGIGLAAWIFSFIVGVGYYGRQDKKIREISESEGPTSETLMPIVKQYFLVNSIEVLVLVLVVVDMTVKPGA
jgi:uncharacterized membrane protein